MRSRTHSTARRVHNLCKTRNNTFSQAVELSMCETATALVFLCVVCWVFSLLIHTKLGVQMTERYIIFILHKSGRPFCMQAAFDKAVGRNLYIHRKNKNNTRVLLPSNKNCVCWLHVCWWHREHIIALGRVFFCVCLACSLCCDQRGESWVQLDAVIYRGNVSDVSVWRNKKED